MPESAFGNRPKTAFQPARCCGLVFGLGLFTAHCTGTVHVSDPDSADATPPRIGPGTPTSLPPVAPAPTTRFFRLTHTQWTNVVHTLLGTTETPDWAASFRADAQTGGFLFDNEAVALTVDEPLYSAYRRIAGEVADFAFEQNLLQAPEGPNDLARATAFVETFGRKVHREPLTETEVSQYLSLFQTGSNNPLQGQDALTSGLQLVVEAMLSSPRFLYRFESSQNELSNAITLGPFEVASRLSFALWNTMPDEELLTAAANGQLSTPEQIRGQAVRLLADPRAAAVNQRFHAAFLELSRYANIDPNEELFPNMSSLAQSATEETTRVLEEAFNEDHGWRWLLTTQQTWANPQLASIYGVSVSGSGFSKVELPAGERRGIFTQVGFLASHATSTQPDPIHRGVFLTKRVACNPLGAPPDVLPPLPPPNGRTNRELVSDHTETGSCANCHTHLINPFGFVFESFDAVGKTRATDNGVPVNTQASPWIEGPVPVANALELMEHMEEAVSVHECYAKYWVEYIFGRDISPIDEGLTKRLAQLSQRGASIRELLAETVSSPAFYTRSTEEIE